ncbi:MAG: SUF system NifU family Fe-S cluster assembly protein [bacterium]|nr:SUF system NifU family Fe-S cluster assembly protein [bacterium]
MNEDIKRQIIIDNYQNPANYQTIKDNTYISLNSNNESCIDNINLFVKLENNLIKDIKFNGEACVICISTTSIMTKLLIGKTIKEAKNIINNYLSMINEQPYNKDILEDACIYNSIAKQPSRIKCATITWNSINNLLNNK